MGIKSPKARTGKEQLLDRPLTIQDLRIVGLLAQGRTYKSIADEIGISFNTVHLHVWKCQAKLGCENTTQMVVMAIKGKMIDCDGKVRNQNDGGNEEDE